MLLFPRAPSTNFVNLFLFVVFSVLQKRQDQSFFEKGIQNVLVLDTFLWSQNVLIRPTYVPIWASRTRMTTTPDLRYNEQATAVPNSSPDVSLNSARRRCSRTSTIGLD